MIKCEVLTCGILNPYFEAIVVKGNHYGHKVDARNAEFFSCRKGGFLLFRDCYFNSELISICPASSLWTGHFSAMSINLSNCLSSKSPSNSISR